MSRGLSSAFPDLGINTLRIGEALYLNNWLKLSAFTWLSRFSLVRMFPSIPGDRFPRLRYTVSTAETRMSRLHSHWLNCVSTWIERTPYLPAARHNHICFLDLSWKRALLWWNIGQSLLSMHFRRRGVRHLVSLLISARSVSKIKWFWSRNFRFPWLLLLFVQYFLVTMYPLSRLVVISLKPVIFTLGNKPRLFELRKIRLVLQRERYR